MIFNKFTANKVTSSNCLNEFIRFSISISNYVLSDSTIMRELDDFMQRSGDLSFSYPFHQWVQWL